jgi:hypothetical protein
VKLLLAVLMGAVVGAAAIYIWSPVGRYQMVFDPQPGEYTRFLLLDTRSGTVYLCDRTGCASDPVTPGQRSGPCVWSFPMLPDIDDMLREGIPLPEAFAIWSEMMRAQHRGPDVLVGRYQVLAAINSNAAVRRSSFLSIWPM